MKKLIVLLLLLLPLTACGAPSEEVIYEDVISILEEDLPGEGIFDSEFSSQQMTEIQDLGEGLYEVKGHIQTPYDGIYPYTMKIKYEDGDWAEYEWVTQ